MVITATFRAVPLAVLLGVFCSGVGCRQLLDIEDAKLDSLRTTTNKEDQSGLVARDAAPAPKEQPELGALDAGATPDEPAEKPAEKPAEHTAAVEDTGTKTPVATPSDTADAGTVDSTPAPPPPMPNLCLLYCDQLRSSCEGEFEQFTSIDTCRDACELLPPGQVGDKGVNTVQCRFAQAKLAKSTGEQDFYCPSAGPLGNDKCGENCEAFCDLMMGACNKTTLKFDANDKTTTYKDRASCLADCKNVTDLGGFALGIPGDNLQCRTYHVVASTQDAFHCEHARGDGVTCADE